MRIGEWENDGGFWVECENETEGGSGICCIACENERGWVL